MSVRGPLPSLRGLDGAEPLRCGRRTPFPTGPGAAGSPARVGVTPYAEGREPSSGVPRPGSLPLMAGVCTASTGVSGIRRGTAGLLPSRAPAVPRRSHALAGSPRELTTGCTAPPGRGQGPRSPSSVDPPRCSSDRCPPKLPPSRARARTTTPRPARIEPRGWTHAGAGLA